MAEKYTRRCENWLQSWLEWTLPRSIAPESVLTLCGLFALSSAVRRHVKVGKYYLGGWECYPHLYITFVAEPGVITKSTSIGFVEDLLDHLPNIRRTPETFTVPIIGKTLEDSPDSSICMIVPEFGTVAEKCGPDLYTVLTNLFDGKKRYDEATISRGAILAVNPVVNLLAATTPDWVGDNMSQGVLGGGYGSRNIFIHETSPRNPRLMYNLVHSEKDYAALRENLLADLEYISEFIVGDFTFAPGADLFFEEWYQKHLTPNPDQRKIKGYIQRRPAYIMKVAMLLTIAQTDELVLYKEILQAAIALLEGFEKKMLSTFRSVGKNKYTADLFGIMEYVKDKKRVRRDELLLEFIATAEPAHLDTFITGLVQMNKISISLDKGDAVYEWVG